jgi:SAM-dependent methyltransferase
MSAKHLFRRCLMFQGVVLCLMGWSGLALAQTGGAGIAEPSPGQGGKDVMWLPTEQALVDKMLDLAKVTPVDHVIDLGSGDGRIVITAARRGARALGIEYNSNLVAVSKRNAALAGVADRAQFVQGDIFEKDFSPATVLTLFLLPELNLRLRPQILDMKPGTRIVSNSFGMADWEPDQRLVLTSAEGCKYSPSCDILLWIVPAKVGGIWSLPQGELQLRQEFQILTGTLKKGDSVIPIADGRVEGNQIRFRIDAAHYAGELVGNSLQGTVTGDPNGHWTGQRGNR